MVLYNKSLNGLSDFIFIPVVIHVYSNYWLIPCEVALCLEVCQIFSKKYQCPQYI